MEIVVILFVILFVAGLFALPLKLKHWFTGLPLLFILAFSTYGALLAFGLSAESGLIYSFNLAGRLTLIFSIDKLSAFFILTVNFTVLTGYLFAGRYMAAYHTTHSPLSFSVHYLSFLLLYISMLLVCTQQKAFPFLVAWELMTISSFLLVIFDTRSRSTLKTGINYLVQMHISMFLILLAFLITYKDISSFGFTALPEYFSTHQEFPVFLLFFAGFGIKAGFFPFHTWLPDAHPAAPSHVSGIMSGVMIKMGIYGMVRVIFAVQEDFMAIGLFLLAVSLFTGIYGVMQAIVQHDLKKLLAYHSIENIGIIGIGLGLGCIGLATHNYLLAILGFVGGLLHVLNHSLFKSLLFYTAGNVYQATRSRIIDKLGGLGKKMPATTFFFLLGSLSICGLPPFNGFISEYLLYLGMISSIHHAGLYEAIVLIFSLLGLTLIGGLAIFCFTKAFSVIFLGMPRSHHSDQATEPAVSGFLPQVLIGILIIAIGLIPLLFVKPILGIVTIPFNLPLDAGKSSFLSNLGMISLTGGIFIVVTVFILLIRYLVLRTRSQETGPTWGCGYTAGSAKMQYTATSYADNLAGLAGIAVNVKKDFESIPGEEVFPLPRTFSSHASEKLESVIIDPPVLFLRKLLRRLAFLQTGQIRHYVLYPFLFILLIFILSLLHLI